jgi:hypothetical protein
MATPDGGRSGNGAYRSGGRKEATCRTSHHGENSQWIKTSGHGSGRRG